MQVYTPNQDAPVQEWMNGQPVQTENLTAYEAAKLVDLRRAYLVLPDTLPGRYMSFTFCEAYHVIKQQIADGHRVGVVICYS